MIFAQLSAIPRIPLHRLLDTVPEGDFGIVAEDRASLGDIGDKADDFAGARSTQSDFGFALEQSFELLGEIHQVRPLTVREIDRLVFDHIEFRERQDDSLNGIVDIREVEAFILTKDRNRLTRAHFADEERDNTLRVVVHSVDV